MFKLDTWEEILNNLRQNKLRTFLTVMGVFWGIFILTILQGTGKGLENGMMTAFGDYVVNSIYIWTQPTTMPYRGIEAGQTPELSMQDVEMVKSQFGDVVEHIAPRIEMGELPVHVGNTTLPFAVRGETPKLTVVEPIRIEGRFFNEPDLAKQRKVVVIGQRLREVFFEDGNPIGQDLEINGVNFLVVGVLHSKKNGDEAAKEEQTAFIPLSVAQQMENMNNQIGWFICTLRHDVDASRFEEKLKNMLKSRHGVHPDDRQGVVSFNMIKTFKRYTGLFAAIRAFLWFVAIGTLFAGIIGVSNIMLIIVKERTREIGIRKAVGAAPGSIVGLIIFESVVITIVAGYLGLLAGAGIVALTEYILNQFGLNSQFFTNPEIDLVLCLQALAVLVIAGALAGMAPAIKASKVNPVVALRNE